MLSAFIDNSASDDRLYADRETLTLQRGPPDPPELDGSKDLKNLWPQPDDI
jgi:hypothetical protein